MPTAARVTNHVPHLLLFQASNHEFVHVVSKISLATDPSGHIRYKPQQPEVPLVADAIIAL